MRLLFCVLLFSGVVSAQELTFKNKGQVVKTMSLAQIKALGVKSVTVHDMNEDKDVTYKAVPLRAILNQVYGKAEWTQSEEILLTCTDGYQPSVPAEVLVQYESFLAFEREGASTFTITAKAENNRTVEAGPFYIIWNNIQEKGMTPGDGTIWAFKLASFDLTNFSEKFPRLAPPQPVSKSVKNGFLAFRRNCMECHSLNGEGGVVGPELNYPVNITEYYKESWLRQWIDNPKSIRFRTIMPPLHADVKDRTEVIEQIISYFKAMKNRKIEPKPSTTPTP